MKNSTIAAIATPYGNSGIGIIKISGDKAFAICDRIFVPGKGCFAEKAANTITYGTVRNPDTGEQLDKVMVSKMQGPHSYTGEDVAEINCHGGVVVLRSVLALVLSMGACPAAPGEFTERAFLNGKMDLIQAESTMSLINSKAEKAARIALNQMNGGLSERVNAIADSLVSIMAAMDMSTDFDELDMIKYDGKDAAKQLAPIVRELSELVGTFERGRRAIEGLTVVICGEPNTGKSSLLNRILGRERAIVTEIAGTTRDTLEECISLDGYPVRLVDTAGIRESSDTVEQIGIKKAVEALNAADLVIYMIDAAHKDAEKQIVQMKQLTDKYGCRGNTVPVINKIDAVYTEKTDKLAEAAEKITGTQALKVSVLENKDIDTIIDKITEFCAIEDDTVASGILVNERHRDLALRAVESLSRAVDAGNFGIPLDVMYIDVRGASLCLAELTGRAIDEDILNQLFSKFCVGK